MQKYQVLILATITAKNDCTFQDIKDGINSLDRFHLPDGSPATFQNIDEVKDLAFMAEVEEASLIGSICLECKKSISRGLAELNYEHEDFCSLFPPDEDEDDEETLLTGLYHDAEVDMPYKSYKEIERIYVAMYAEEMNLNIDTQENFKEAAQELFVELQKLSSNKTEVIYLPSYK